MQKNLLQSLINITGQRDIESLEYSLVATIAELFPVAAISLYKPVHETGYTEAEITLHLEIRKTEPHYVWNKKPLVIKTPPLLQQCFFEGVLLEKNTPGETGECYIPICIQTKISAVLCIKSSALVPTDIQTLVSLTKIYENYLVILHENERDKLTSLLNRRTFEQRFDNLLIAQKNRQKVATGEFGPDNQRHVDRTSQVHLAMIDIDHFKNVNDEYGHVYGDEILILIANLMRSTFRSSDLLFRFGGEEFVILLEPTSSEMAFLALERFRHAIEQHEFPQVGKVTVSIGFTVINEATLYTSSMGRAGRALYHAKHNGRNCTHSFEKLIDDGQLSHAHKVGPVEMFKF